MAESPAGCLRPPVVDVDERVDEEEEEEEDEEDEEEEEEEEERVDEEEVDWKPGSNRCEPMELPRRTANMFLLLLLLIGLL